MTSTQQTIAFIAIISFFLAGCVQEMKKDYTKWEIYRGDEGSNAYSKLDQINKENVSNSR